MVATWTEGQRRSLEQAFPNTQGGLFIGLGHLNITTDLLHALRKGWAEREKALVQGQSAGMSSLPAIFLQRSVGKDQL